MRRIAHFKRAIEDKRLARIPRICFCHVPKCAGSSLVDALRNHYSLVDKILFRNFYVDLQASARAAEVTVPTLRAGNHTACAGRSAESTMYIRECVLAYVLATRQYKYAGGHIRCRPQLVDAFLDKWDFVTVLRDPVERWISGYVYDRYKDESWTKLEIDVEEYLESPAGILNGKLYLWYFSDMPADAPARDQEAYIEEAEQNLRRFAIVGTTENMQQFGESFRRRFGKPLKIGRANPSPNPEQKQRIKSNPELMGRIRDLNRLDIELYRRLQAGPQDE